MAEQPITGLTEKTTPLVDDDLFVIVDSEAVPETTKKVKKQTFLNSLLVSVAKDTVGTLNAGEVIRLEGYNATLDVSTVELAGNASAATMPALGIMATSATDLVAGTAIIVGRISGLNTSALSVGDPVWVGSTLGTLTATKPTGTALIQQMGIVTRSDLTEGVLEIFGTGRTNDLPNLPTDDFWIGNGGSVPAAVNFDDAVSANPDISANTTHRSSDGKDHSDVVLNNTHRSSDGSDHSDVVSNTNHSIGDGSDHSDVASNTTHRTTTTGNPHSVDYSDVSSADAATDVTGAELETLTDGSNADALHVHAGGSQLDRFNANDATFPSTDPAITISRNEHPVVEFTNGVTRNTIFHSTMSNDYSNGSLSVDIKWVSKAATTGNVEWAAAFERMNTDIDADSFAANQTVTTTTNGTSGVITTTTITFTQAQADGIAAGESYRLRIRRSGGTMADPSQILRVSLRQ